MFKPPNTISFDASIIEFAPIAVEYCIDVFDVFVSEPTYVLLLPLISLLPALYPIATLFEPSFKFINEYVPTAVLLFPEFKNND